MDGRVRVGPSAWPYRSNRRRPCALGPCGYPPIHRVAGLSAVPGGQKADLKSERQGLRR